MKSVLIVLFCFSVTLAGDDAQKRELVRNGLPAKVSVRVRDQDGAIVPDADVLLSFSIHNQRESNIVKVKTDAMGIASGEARLNNRIAIHVSKNGYYRTFFQYSPWSHGSYDSGRWEPWNPMLDAVLREIRTPLRTPRRMNTIHHLRQAETYGYDLLENKIVNPDDSECHADFWVTGTGDYYDKKTSPFDAWEKTVTVKFPSIGDGLVRKKRNLESDFKFDYQAPLEGYRQTTEFTLSRIPGKTNNPFLESDEYFHFRISRTNPETGEIDHYYGIILRLLQWKDWDTNESVFSIHYVINPTPEDRNTEF